MNPHQGRLPIQIAHFENYRFLDATARASAETIDSKSAELRGKVRFRDLFERQRARIVHDCLLGTLILLL